MREANYCSICGQPWGRHVSDLCDDIASQFEDESDLDEDLDDDDILWLQFGARLDDGFHMLSGCDED